MANWTEEQKQKYARFQEILEIGKQRYVEAGGNPRYYRAGFKGQDYLTDGERKEATRIMRQMFGISIANGYVYCQGRSWELPENLPLDKKQVEADS
ncbi:MAG: hypothetical protein RMY36_017535 [Nostoc sp. SerVER01]|nr:hypothetical protein [Nostoc sp. SerVER01]MDZ8026626.1 hypothetical protein [Nostoc sp. DedQUE11]MDZ8072940.1 hypothetical protein [Nostoc sp. DedQUE01]MDZ8080550.1 hypothetical protein [Nostoc sp. DcaGUA01]MDZ8238009.1 hypothetical protein [Nostoc sp. ChiQUE01a]